MKAKFADACVQELQGGEEVLRILFCFGRTHQPHKVAPALVDGRRSEVDVASEAILHEAKLGRLERVPAHCKEDDEDHEETNAAAGTAPVPVLRIVIRAALTVVAIVLVRARSTAHASDGESSHGAAVARAPMSARGSALTMASLMMCSVQHRESCNCFVLQFI